MGRRLGLVIVAAVVIGLMAGGGAYAGSKITSAQIKDGTIVGRDVKSHGLTGREIADASLSEDKLTDGALRTLKGTPGPAGPSGPVGPPGASSLTRVNGPRVAQGAFGSGAEVQTSTATCPPGTYVSGGGFDARSIENIVAYASSSLTQYSVIAVNEYSQAGSIGAQAICVGGSSVVASRARVTAPPRSVVAIAHRLQAAVNAGDRP